MKTLPVSVFSHGARACILAGALTAAHIVSAENPDPAGLIREVFDTVREAETLSAEITYTVRIRMAGMDDGMETRYRFAYEAPNKVAVVLRDGLSGKNLISDGDEVFVHVPMVESYTVNPAPGEIGEVLEQSFPLGGELMMVLQALMTGKIAGLDIASLGDPEYLGVEERDDGVVHTVRLPLRQAEFSEQLGEDWRQELDAEELAMFDALNVEVDIDLSILKGERTFLVGAKADLTEFMRQMADQQMAPGLGEMEMEMIFALSDWTADESLPADTFTFEPPEGTREVDDLFTALEQQASEPMSGGDVDSLVGEAAPDFELPLLDGGESALADHRGEDIVILDFWATWCGPCIQAMPALMDVASEYRDRNVVFYAINLRESEDQVKGFLETRDWNLVVPMDADGSVADAYGVTGIPHTVIVGKDGTLEKVHVGFSPTLKESLSNEIERLLAAE